MVLYEIILAVSSLPGEQMSVLDQKGKGKGMGKGNEKGNGKGKGRRKKTKAGRKDRKEQS